MFRTIRKFHALGNHDFATAADGFVHSKFFIRFTISRHTTAASARQFTPLAPGRILYECIPKTNLSRRLIKGLTQRGGKSGDTLAGVLPPQRPVMYNSRACTKTPDGCLLF